MFYTNRNFPLPFPLTEDKELLEDPDYIKIVKVLENLWSTGVIANGGGHCYGMSDIVHTMLKQEGIDNAMVECSLLVFSNNPPGVNLVGYKNNIPLQSDFETPTHVVCITTRTKYPILIDLSIYGMINTIPLVIERVTEDFYNVDRNSENAKRISDYMFKDGRFIYTEKKENKLALIHEKNIIQRAISDKKIEGQIGYLKKIIFLLAFLTSLNFIRGSFDFAQKYLIRDNQFGPNQTTFVK